MKGTHWQYGTGFQKILERRIVKRTLYFVMWQRWDPYSLKFCTTLSFQMIWCKFQSILVSHSSPIQYLNTVNPKALQQEREISSNQPKILHEFTLIIWIFLLSATNSSKDILRREHTIQFSTFTGDNIQKWNQH